MGNIIRSMCQKPKAQAIHQYVKENYQSKITLSDLIKLFHCDCHYIGFMFQQLYGITIWQYANNLRIEYACQLLLDENLPINQIGIKSGFSSIETFDREFKTRMFCSPSSYRLKKVIKKFL